MAQVWDGVQLKLTFRRCVDMTGFERWNQLVEMVRKTQLRDENDTPPPPIWSFETNGVYSVKSLYKQINLWGVVSAVYDKLWKVLCPQKIRVFLWLGVYNKILTRDNLGKRRQVDDMTRLFLQ